jgi:hypothetical protein
MNTKVAEIIAEGNKAYYGNSTKSKLWKKNTEMKTYKTMIRLVVTQSSETWT